MPSILEHHIDFSIIETGNPASFYFVDESSYYKAPEYPLLEVWFPNDKECYSMLIRPERGNPINTQQIGWVTTIQDFPDGLYTVRYSVAPNSIVFKTIKYLRTAIIKERIGKILLKDINDDLINRLYKIDLFLQAGKEIACIDEDKAVDYYKQADKELKKIECNGV